MNIIGRFFIWAKEPIHFWLCIIVLMILTILIIPSPSELLNRIVGLGLQFGGLTTVAWGLSQTRKLFGLPSIFESTKEWFRRFPGKPINHRLEIGTGELLITGYPLDVWITASPTASNERRIEVLEENLKRVNNKTNDIQNQLNKEVMNHREMFAQEKKLREQADEGIRNKMFLSQTGGIKLSLVGLIWLSYGLTLCTFPVEIASLIKRITSTGLL